jgi:hypothetical protein
MQSTSSPYTYPYPAPAPYGTPYPETRRGFHAAHGFFWVIFWFLTICVAMGLNWDRHWHATHVFDTFFSPPHLFVYTTVAIAGVMTAIVVFTPRLRQWFGPGFHFFLFPFEVPGALFILGAGFITLLLAGGLDSLWHSNFGLDETGWSTPHAMIGWGLLMIYLGFAACYLALRQYKSSEGFSRVSDTLAVLTLMFFALTYSFTPFNGPIGDNISPLTVYAISRLPILLAEPAAQHTYRIYLDWNLTRANPIFVPLSALWAGTALAFIRRIDRRVWIFLVAVLIWTILQLGGTRDAVLVAVANALHRPSVVLLGLPVPILIPALVFAGLSALKLDERWAWAIGGLFFGFLTAVIWTWVPSRGLFILLLPLLAAPAMLLGGLLGKAAFQSIARPAERGHAAIVLFGVAVPLCVGMIDLFLRTHTP